MRSRAVASSPEAFALWADFVIALEVLIEWHEFVKNGQCPKCSAKCFEIYDAGIEKRDFETPGYRMRVRSAYVDPDQWSDNVLLKLK